MVLLENSCNQGNKTMSNWQNKAKDILRSDQPEGISNAANQKAWSDRAKSNSYGNNKAQARDILSGVGVAKDAKGDWSDDWQQAQRKTEGRCFAPINKAAVPNTYTTDKGGSKR
jgi:hypothetical protein